MQDKHLKGGADWLLITVILAIVAIVLFAVPARAEMKQAKGLVCDTQEQIENWLTLFHNGTPGEEALEQVNAGTTACGVLHVVADIEEVKEGAFNGQPFVIYKLTLMAVMTPMGPIPVDPLVQYMAGPKRKHAQDA